MSTALGSRRPPAEEEGGGHTALGREGRGRQHEGPVGRQHFLEKMAVDKQEGQISQAMLGCGGELLLASSRVGTSLGCTSASSVIWASLVIPDIISHLQEGSEVTVQCSMRIKIIDRKFPGPDFDTW